MTLVSQVSGVKGCRAKAGICYAVESEWEQGHRHHTYCIYYSTKKQGSEGKEEIDKSEG